MGHNWIGLGHNWIGPGHSWIGIGHSWIGPGHSWTGLDHNWADIDRSWPGLGLVISGLGWTIAGVGLAVDGLGWAISWRLYGSVAWLDFDLSDILDIGHEPLVMVRHVGDHLDPPVRQVNLVLALRYQVNCYKKILSFFCQRMHIAQLRNFISLKFENKLLSHFVKNRE